MGMGLVITATAIVARIDNAKTPKTALTMIFTVRVSPANANAARTTRATTMKPKATAVRFFNKDAASPVSLQ